MRIFIINNASGGLMYDNRWKWVAEELQQEECVESVTVIEAVRTRDFKYNQFHSAASLSNGIIKHLSDDIDENSVIIFADARDSLAFILQEFRMRHELKFKMIGFWVDGHHYLRGDVKTRLRFVDNHDWMSKYERGLAACYDYNLITMESVLNSFKKYHNIRLVDKIMYCPLPFSNTTQYIENYVAKEDILKSDLVVLNTSPHSTHDLQIYEALQVEFKDYEFINVYNQLTTPVEYWRTLARAKVVISTNLSDSNPYSIYESMRLNCVPVLPDIPVYREMFNEDWLFPEIVLKPPYLNYIRNSEKIHEKVWNSMENYVSYNIQDEVKRIHDTYYDSTHLKKLLCSINQ